jgi:hypothetical protein
VASVVVVLAVLPGRWRRAWVLLAAGAGAALAAPATLVVYTHAVGGLPDGPRRAGLVLAVTAVLAGAGWWVGTRVAEGFAPATRARLRVGVPIAAVVLGLLALSIRVGDPIQRIKDNYYEFTSPTGGPPPAGASRFGVANGVRYDLWSIAWHQFEAQPIRGIGAGNYETPWLRLRRTPEPAETPHSLPLQLLAEEGIVGALAFAAFVVAVAVGLSRRRRAAPGVERALVVGAAGLFTAWLAQAAVDRTTDFLTLSCLGMVAAATLTAVPASRRAGARAAAIALTGLVALAGVLVVGRTVVSDAFRARADADLASDPSAALSNANRAADIDGDSTSALYAKAGALVQLRRYPAAEQALLEARRLDAAGFVPLAMLGDLAARRGDLAQARAYFQQAAARNRFQWKLPRYAQCPRAAATGLLIEKRYEPQAADHRPCPT